MKKTILAAVMAGLVGFNALASDDIQQLRLNIEKADDGPTVVKVVENGADYEFTLTEQELKDEAVLANKLAALTEANRKNVIKALSGISGDRHLMFISEDELHKDMEGEVVLTKEITFDSDDGQERHIMIKIDSDEQGDGVHRAFNSGDSKTFAFSFGDKDVEFVHEGSGSEHSVKLLEVLLDNAELSQEQIDKLQQLLDKKRK